jgi:uncharacterized membrane protein
MILCGSGRDRLERSKPMSDELPDAVHSPPYVEAETTEDDKLWAALSWIPVSPLYPIVAILVLLVEGKKDRPFIRYNAVLALVTGIALIPISIVTMGLGAVGYLFFFYWAYQAFQGEMVHIPWLSDWIKDRNWA